MAWVEVEVKLHGDKHSAGHFNVSTVSVVWLYWLGCKLMHLVSLTHVCVCALG